MLKKSKTTSWMLTVLLAFSLIVSACSNSNSSEGGTTSSPSPSPSSSDGAESTLEPYQLDLYFPGDPQRDTEKVEQAVNEYLQDKINATVKINFVPWGDEYTQKIPVLLATGTKMDVVFTNSEYMPPLANRGALLPVNDLLEQYGQDALASLYDKFLDLTKIKGQNYAVQNTKEIANQWVIRFNMEQAEKHNLDVMSINSVAGAKDVLAKMKAADPSMYPIEPTLNPGGMWYVPFDYVISGSIPFGMIYGKDSSEQKIVNMWETEEAKEMLNTVRDYYKEGFLRPDASTYTRPANEDQAGQWLAGVHGGIPTAEVIWSNATGLNVEYVPIEKPIVTTNSIMGSMLSIPTTSANPERAMMFINLLHSDVYLHNLLVYGIEGVHYEKISDNVVKPLPAKNEGWNVGWFLFGNGYLTYLTEADPSDKWEQFKNFNNEAQVSPLVGFIFDPTPVQNEIAAIQSVSSAIHRPLVNGSVDPEEFLPQAIEKLKAAGADKVMAEMQSQFDAWKATQ